ncbi:MAG: hypothetical protein LBQ94_02560 [Treponema sp.]|jgi:hypothetical protein|nr:hypothetical protein [Treponema sp.]
MLKIKTRITRLLLAAALLALYTGGAYAQEANNAVVNAPVGGSIAQIVAFYNQCANAVKAADRITIVKFDERKMNMEIPFILRALVPREMREYPPSQNTTVMETFVNGEGTNDAERKLTGFLPVTGKIVVSQLRASHVQSATCVKRGDDWIVTIALKDEPLDTLLNNTRDYENMSEADRENLMDDFLLESGYGSSMELMTMESERQDSERQPSNIDSKLLKYDGGFQNGRIVAAIDQEGRLTSLTHSYDMNMNVSFLLMKMRMSSSLKQDYQFIYPAG